MLNINISISRGQVAKRIMHLQSQPKELQIEAKTLLQKFPVQKTLQKLTIVKIRKILQHIHDTFLSTLKQVFSILSSNLPSITKNYNGNINIFGEF